tara:strand:- start:4477 stop:5265 length:789 start_codon:yes stop_codon:yes gene_type:complete
MKTIYYYQTFIGLYKMLSHIQDIDVIIVSSIHFGKEKDGEKKIYLNDNSPDNNIFDDLWMETKKASVQGCKIMVMMGGAGLAYNELFTDFNIYYPQLVQMLKDRPWIQGIDLDIEEHASLENIQMLINKLVEDFGEEFTITMAPISPSLMSDGGSMSGINYKQLYQSDEGKYIHWFNTQCYDSFTKDTYDSIIQNGYPPEKIVMGMESGQFNENTFKNALETIVQIKKKYPQVGGFYDWEYLNAPPDKKDPSQWAKLIKQCL